MTSGIQFKQGDILIAPFPFTDLSSIKQRPILVLSKQNEGNDIITCGITSNLADDKLSVLISQKDLLEGSIPKTSRIKVGKIFTIEKSIIRKKVGRINSTIMKNVKKIYNKLV